MSRSYWNSAVLRAGIKLGIFPLLDNNPLPASGIAGEIGAPPRFAEAFLEASVVLGLLDKDGDVFRNSAMGSAFFIPGKQEYVGDLVPHITNYWQTWGNPDRLTVEGRTELPFENGFTDAATYWTDYMRGQHDRAAAGQGKHLVDSVDLRGRGKMLDLGGGAGSYSIALCGANPVPLPTHLALITAEKPPRVESGIETTRASLPRNP